MFLLANALSSSLMGSSGAVITPRVYSQNPGELTVQASYSFYNHVALYINSAVGMPLKNWELGVSKELPIGNPSFLTATPVVVHTKYSFVGFRRKIALASYIFIPLSEGQNFFAVPMVVFGDKGLGPWELNFGAGIDTITPFDDLHVFVNFTRNILKMRNGGGIWASVDILNHQYPVRYFRYDYRGMVNIDVKFLPVPWFIVHVYALDLADASRSFGIGFQFYMKLGR